MSATSAGSAATRDRLIALVSPLIRQAGYELEDLVLTPMGRRSLLRVVIDRDEGVSLDDVAGLSRAVAEALDEAEGVIGKSPYVLEVTSPGIDRPLTEARHWRRAVGRLIEVTVRSRPTEASGSAQEKVMRGRIVAFDETAVTLNVDGDEHVLPLGDLDAGKMQLEFNRRDEGAKPERAKRQHKGKDKAKRVRAAMDVDAAFSSTEEK